MSEKPAIKSSLAQRFGDVNGTVNVDNPVTASMVSRGSCRQFADRVVDPALIRTLCAVALCSPTKSDLQQRDIIHIQSDTQREKIRALYGEREWFVHAPVILVICGNGRRLRQIAGWKNKPFPNDHLDAFFNASVDAGIALSALVVAAESAGLGCCPISVMRNRIFELAEILQLPDYVFPVAGLVLGWPREKAPVSMRLPLESTLHTDVFCDDRLEQQVQTYDRAREALQPVKAQRLQQRFGKCDDYAWSEDKARQYSEQQRADFGAFIRSKKFNLE